MPDQSFEYAGPPGGNFSGQGFAPAAGRGFQQIPQTMFGPPGQQMYPGGSPGGPPTGGYSPFMPAQPQGPQTQFPPAGGASGGPAPNPYYGNLGGYTPLPYQAFGAIPQVAGITPGAIGGFLPGYASAVETAMAPEFAQQQQQLDQDMASRGIFNSGAANAGTGNLLAQQFGQVLGQSLPMAQQDIMSNQNTAAGNAQMYGNITSGNEAAYNNYLNSLFQGNMNRGNTLMGGVLGSYGGANPGAIGILGEGASAAGNAYQQGLGAGGPLGNAFGQLFGTWGQANPSQAPGPYSGDYTKD